MPPGRPRGAALQSRSDGPGEPSHPWGHNETRPRKVPVVTCQGQVFINPDFRWRIRHFVVQACTVQASCLHHGQCPDMIDDQRSHQAVAASASAGPVADNGKPYPARTSLIHSSRGKLPFFIGLVELGALNFQLSSHSGTALWHFALRKQVVVSRWPSFEHIRPVHAPALSCS